MEETAKIIGFIGLGAMGNPMSHRLLEAGYSLRRFGSADLSNGQVRRVGTKRFLRGYEDLGKVDQNGGSFNIRTKVKK